MLAKIRLPLFFSLSLAGAVPALAAGIQLWDQSATGIGVSQAGSAATAENSSALFYNPASMTLLPGVQASAGYAGIQTQYQFQTGDDAGRWTSLPNASLTAQLAPKLFAGVGVTTPFSLNTRYGDNWVGNNQAIYSRLRTVNVNPALAYQVNDKVALGVGLNIQKADLDLTSTGAAFSGDDTAYGWNAGGLFTLSPAMRVGVAYRSAMRYKLEGTNNGEAAQANLKLPATMTLSVWQQVSEQWEAMGDLSYTRWSGQGDLGVANGGTAFGGKNAWRVAWGAAYKANDAWKLKFGIAYEQSPVTLGNRTARLPDDDQLRLSVGAQWKTPGYGVFDFGYSYVYIKEPGVSNGVQGNYDAGAHIVGVQYSAGF